MMTKDDVITALMDALRPFADQAETFDSAGAEFVPDRFEPAIVGHTIGDLRAARAAIILAGGAQVNVAVTDKGAIYVNESRITDRSTKWGTHTHVDAFRCEQRDVLRTCIERGHAGPVQRVDDPAYAGQKACAAIAKATAQPEGGV